MNTISASFWNVIRKRSHLGSVVILRVDLGSLSREFPHQDPAIFVTARTRMTLHEWVSGAYIRCISITLTTVARGLSLAVTISKRPRKQPLDSTGYKWVRGQSAIRFGRWMRLSATAITEVPNNDPYARIYSRLNTGLL